MAFNPFAAFQKNKKFWMAAVLLICMVTFVFCTGTREGLQDRIVNLFRKRGDTVLTVAGHRLTYDDLSKMRSDRNMVNEYMRQCCELTISNLTQILQKERDKSGKGAKQDEKHAQEMTKVSGYQMSLEERLRKPRFFSGGVKMADLEEFKLWQVQADRLGIRLEDEHINQLVRIEFFQQILPEQLAQAQANALRGRDREESTLRKALTEEYRVRLAQLAIMEMQPARYLYNLNEPLVDPNMPDQQRFHVTLAQVWDVFKQQRSEFDVTLIPIHVSDFTTEKDIGKPEPLDLEKLFDKYKNQGYDLASPLPNFESPKEYKIEFVMADPTSPMYRGAAQATLLMDTLSPAAVSPMHTPLAAAALYAADGAAKQKRLHDILEGLSQSKAQELYGTTPLMTPNFVIPTATALAAREPRAVASLLAAAPGGLGHPGIMSTTPAVTGFFGEALARHRDTLDAALAAEAKRRLVPYATVLGGILLADPYVSSASVFTALKVEMIPQLGLTFPEPLRLPLPIIQRELENVVIDRNAERAAMDNLLAVKKQLDNAKPATIERIIEEEVIPAKKLTHVITRAVVQDAGGKPIPGAKVVTKGDKQVAVDDKGNPIEGAKIVASGYYNRYNIDKAPELAPLREAYEKYYEQINWFEKRDVGDPAKKLKETDFYKLFFDAESFTSGTKYLVRPWPPEVIPSQTQLGVLPGVGRTKMPQFKEGVIDDVQRFVTKHDPKSGKRYALLDRAQKPILFWWVDEHAAVKPKSVAEAGDRVIDAWKTEKAREAKALPLAKEIAEKLVAKNGDFRSDLIDSARSQAGGHELIKLAKIAPFVPKTQGEAGRAGSRTYGPYALPKDTIPSSREDTVANLLALYDLKKSFEVKLNLKEGDPAFVKQLNDINKALWDKVQTGPGLKDERKGRYVQVLTNSPQTIYYVALIPPEKIPEASYKEFRESVVRDAFGLPERMMIEPSFVDTFMAHAQEHLAHEFRARFLSALREELGYTAPDDKQRNDFDASDHGG